MNRAKEYSAFITVLFAVLISPIVVAQKETDEDEIYEQIFIRDIPVTIDLDSEEEQEERAQPKIQKRKKKVFYGFKTKKGFTKSGFGNSVTLELFHYLKVYQQPNPYVREIYWYDFRRKSIRKTLKVDRDYGVILHGPYKKIIGDQVIEEGIFYIGTKHGRWMTFDKNHTLVDKQKFYKGWPKESMVNYYDQQKTKLREIIPINHGKREGDYFYFHENGNIAVHGRFINDQKIGKWTEYYDRRGRKKKEIQYRQDPYDSKFRPVILKEWNESGGLVYDREEHAKRLSGQ